MGGLSQVRVNAQIHIQVAVLDKYFNSEGKEFFFFPKIEHDQPVERILYCGSVHKQQTVIFYRSFPSPYPTSLLSPSPNFLSKSLFSNCWNFCLFTQKKQFSTHSAHLCGKFYFSSKNLTIFARNTNIQLLDKYFHLGLFKTNKNFARGETEVTIRLYFLKIFCSVEPSLGAEQILRKFAKNYIWILIFWYYESICIRKPVLAPSPEIGENKTFRG